MSSGRQVAEKNVQIFTAWVVSKTDADFRNMTNRGVLSRKEIAKECGFAKSALDQNPRIKSALQDLEHSLRSRGVLPQIVEKNPDLQSAHLVHEPSRLRSAQESERLRRLEQENASLKAEIAELKRTLERHVVLRDALALTGRLPR